MAELTFIIPDVVGLGSRAHKGNVPAGTNAGMAATATRPINQGKGLMSDREVDQQLVVRAQAGDKRAFELLVIK
jgi:RNA polymerase sigma-70 factor (ECF subfamily)